MSLANRRRWAASWRVKYASTLSHPLTRRLLSARRFTWPESPMTTKASSSTPMGRSSATSSGPRHHVQHRPGEVIGYSVRRSGSDHHGGHLVDADPPDPAPSSPGRDMIKDPAVSGDDRQGRRGRGRCSPATRTSVMLDQAGGESAARAIRSSSVNSTSRPPTDGHRLSATCAAGSTSAVVWWCDPGHLLEQTDDELDPRSRRSIWGSFNRSRTASRTT